MTLPSDGVRGEEVAGGVEEGPGVVEELQMPSTPR